MIVPDRLLLATGNRHKVREVREILDPLGIAVLTPDDVGGLREVIEDGATFAANATKKAEAARDQTGLWALADDSGIEARALDGRPGVYSARFAGPACDDTANNAELDRLLRAFDDRQVQYRCVIALARPDAETLIWDGVFAGIWTSEARGSGGFGYDPHVYLPDVGCTVAELPAATKHARSHRGQALRAFVDWLRQTDGGW